MWQMNNLVKIVGDQVFLRKKPGLHRREIEVMLENDEMHLLFGRGSTNVLKVIFGGIIHKEKWYFSGYSSHFLNNTDDHILFFRDVKNSWMYEDGLYEALIGIIHEIKAEYNITRTELFGTSMGGFTAFLVSEAVEADQVVTMGPIFSTDIEVIPEDRRHWEHISGYNPRIFPSLEGYISDDIDYTAIFGGKGHDMKYQIPKFVRHPNIKIYVLDEFEHYFSEELKAHGVYDALIDAAFANDEDEILKIIKPFKGRKYH